jgi:molecular chaperone GrpE (heat shock protein)
MVAPEEPENPPPPTGEPPAGGISPAPEPPPPAEPNEEWAIRYRYLLAEFDNYRKRVEREQASIRRDARGLVLRELLPFHDAFDHAEAAAREMPPDDPFRRGLELLSREWDRFLAAEKVQPVAREGEEFRPEEEEAVGELPADADHPGGSVAEVVQQGYRFVGGLLRPAKVLIARSSLGAPATDSSKPTGDVVDDDPPVGKG